MMSGSIMWRWQIQTAPGSVTAYFSVKERRTETVCSVNIHSNTFFSKIFKICWFKLLVISTVPTSRTRWKSKWQLGYDVRHNGLRGVQILQQFTSRPEPALWPWWWWRGGHWWAFRLHTFSFNLDQYFQISIRKVNPVFPPPPLNFPNKEILLKTVHASLKHGKKLINLFRCLSEDDHVCWSLSVFHNLDLSLD